VKPTPAQIILAYLGLAVLLLGVFHKRVGLNDTVGDTLVFVGLSCSLLCLFLYRRHKARLDGAASGEPLKPNRKIMWLSLVLIIVASLSSFFWLPYTGVAVSHTQLIMISATTFVLSITAFFIGWRRSQRSNKSLEPTAGRYDDQI
jgi:amino acid transporter